MSALPVRDAPVRVLFVLAWLVVGGEETELRLLLRALDRTRHAIDVVACFRQPGMPEQTHEQLAALGVKVDRTPYHLSFEDTVAYLAEKMAGYDVVVACQAVPDVYPALERMALAARPALIEHGGLVEEALRGPKHLTDAYVGVCRAIRNAAAARMPGREVRALEIPSMVDLTEFGPNDRAGARAELGVRDGQCLIGWVGRLDRKKRVEDFVDAAALVARDAPHAAKFVVVGGPDSFMPEYRDELRERARAAELVAELSFLGDRADVPRLLGGMDAHPRLSRGEGMPHVIAEAGAARLPVVATRDGGSEQQIVDGVSGLFVPHEEPPAVAAALLRLIGDPLLRARLGAALRAKVERDYAVEAVASRWAALFDELATEAANANARVQQHRSP